jgi:hypothetical protein
VPAKPHGVGEADVVGITLDAEGVLDPLGVIVLRDRLAQQRTIERGRVHVRHALDAALLPMLDQGAEVSGRMSVEWYGRRGRDVWRNARANPPEM